MAGPPQCIRCTVALVPDEGYLLCPTCKYMFDPDCAYFLCPKCETTEKKSIMEVEEGDTAPACDQCASQYLLKEGKLVAQKKGKAKKPFTFSPSSCLSPPATTPATLATPTPPIMPANPAIPETTVHPGIYPNPVTGANGL